MFSTVYTLYKRQVTLTCNPTADSISEIANMVQRKAFFDDEQFITLNGKMTQIVTEESGNYREVIRSINDKMRGYFWFFVVLAVIFASLAESS